MANTPAPAAKEKSAGSGSSPAPAKTAARKKAATAPESSASAPTRGGAKQVTPAERIQALEAEISRIRREEHDSRYQLITAAIAELNAMGYQYRLMDEGKPGAKGTKKTATATTATNAPAEPASGSPKAGGTDGLSSHYDEKKYCKLCKEMGHDQKAHKGEFQHKAFTNEEKAQRGVLPPELQESFLSEQQEASKAGE